MTTKIFKTRRGEVEPKGGSGRSPTRIEVTPERSLEVTPVSAYSRTEYRPESETARLFATLLGQKNLTQANVDVIKRLGFSVKLKGGEL